jgi:acetyl-CoA carboxylase biotin carboxylase subunit
MLKAVAGGGGIGMVICRDAGELRKSFEAAKSRAGSVFADDALYIERYLERPRHVEVQVLGDGRGEVIHLLERECSIQRRHQKVMEECPAPALESLQDLRSRLHSIAAEGARALAYRGAGTLEFLLDPSRGEFFFMEMNARVQVEHPATEMVTGIDIVRAQLGIAAGEDLPARQSEVRASGHAVEVRVCAEDPAKGFVPQPGALGEVAWPAGEGVRCDWGYESGQRVTPWYDSLLAKVIAHGETRAVALERLRGALERTAIAGVKTTLPFLRRLAADAQIAEGRLHTGFLSDRKDLLA